MKQYTFSISINARREKVWSTLWDEKTYRDWSSNIDEDIYIKGELKAGAEVQFISAHGGFGVTNIVEKFQPNELVTFKHTMDTKEFGTQPRPDQWTGGRETYALTELGGVTTLTLTIDIPSDLEGLMPERFTKALQRIKELAEQS